MDVLQSVDVNKNLDLEALQILEPASEPLPARGSLPVKMVIAVMLGLIVGVGIVYLLERADDRVRSSMDVLDRIGMKVVGQVPEMNPPRRGAGLPLLELGDKRHLFAESYRNLRSSLLFMPVEENRPKTLLVTSAVPGEGKSTVTANLAQSLALGGARVLLIDADPRKGTLHKLFGVPSEPGFMDLLNQEVDIDEVVRSTSHPHLFFIPRGKPNKGPGELFLSQATNVFIDQIYSKFDYILFDTAPVLVCDDTSSLAPKVDGVLFVVRSSFTSTRMAREACEQLTHRQAKVLGLVINRADANSGDYTIQVKQYQAQYCAV
jgi:capsular exopolysaccharide synthesis family protein